MLPYWLLFVVWSIGAVQAERRRAQDPRLLFFVGAAALTALMIGVRFEVGGDWGAYDRLYQNIFFLSLPDALRTTDPAYALLNWIGAKANIGVGLANVVCGIVFMAGLARLAWRQPNPALAVLIAVPYLIIVVAMGYTRQAAAIGMICLAAADASERRLVRMVMLIGIAALFHKTAVLVLPIALVPVFRRNALLGILGAGLFLGLFAIVLRGSTDQLVTNYVQADLDSQGAAIRVSMNVLAGVIFLILRNRIVMPPFQKSFWLMCALLAIVSVPGLALSGASAGVDRLALYLIPLQVVVYARLPYLLSGTGRAAPAVLLGLLVYCFAVQFVWLNYANNAYYWVPYKTQLG